MARGERDPARERQWRERMVRWQASDLSVREFCVQHGLIEASFHYWKRELRARDEATAAAQRPAAQRPAVPSPPAKSPAVQPTFVPLTVIPAATVSVEVRCPSGHVVLVSACDAAFLASLFAALNPPASEEPSC